MSVDPGSRGWNEHTHHLPWPLSIVAGKLGLNQSSPAEILDIVGNLKVSGTIRAQAAGSNIVAPAVTAPTFATGFLDYGGAFAPAGYWLDAEGEVHLQGVVTTNSVTGTGMGATMFTLPVGFRPSKEYMFTCVAYKPNYGIIRVDVLTRGAVILAADVGTPAWTPSATPNAVFVSLDNLAFRTT